MKYEPPRSFAVTYVKLCARHGGGPPPPSTHLRWFATRYQSWTVLPVKPSRAIWAAAGPAVATAITSATTTVKAMRFAAPPRPRTKPAEPVSPAVLRFRPDRISRRPGPGLRNNAESIFSTSYPTVCEASVGKGAITSTAATQTALRLTVKELPAPMGRMHHPIG